MEFCFRLDMGFPDAVQVTYFEGEVEYEDESTGDEPGAQTPTADTVALHMPSSDSDSSMVSSSAANDDSGSSHDSDDSSSLDEFSSKDQRKIVAHCIAHYTEVAKDELAFYHAAGRAHFESDAVLNIMDRLAARPPVLHRPGKRYEAAPIYIHRSVGGVC
ncbi:hypothetical protein BDZ85DRAFT_284417 [Elsinoe ampelina]|uniref:Uncharacterized protein n=1 Tax=Elsinoe ampelina TaxID=302913 RepID=A0A6A6G4L2_9PEZI|nr:hypothetical protein BDZ85DRAFT_284417 [Elsinoe ampelina]